MKYKKIGDTTVSQIALGTSGSGSYSTATRSNIKSRVQLYNEAVELGINFFDTAELYGGGFAEEVLGKAILNKRKDVFIASKFNPNRLTSESIISAANSSLKRLKTDYIDLYQMHWPNPDINYNELLTAIDRLLKDGKIKYFGLSNFSYPELKDIKVELKWIPISAIENQYNISRKEITKDILPFCIDNEIIVLAYSPLGQGKLLSSISNNAFIKESCIKYEVTVSQLLLNWLTSQKNIIPVVRTSNINHLKENVKALDFKCEHEVNKKLNDLVATKISNIPIKEIEIQNLDDKKVYSSTDQAEQNPFDWIPSPMLLSKRIKQHKTVEPINLTKKKNHSGKIFYNLDSYDFLGESKKYWAWILANGEHSNIPSILSDSLIINSN